MSSVVIISGCWQQHQQPIHQDLVTNILSFIDGRDDIQSVLLSNRNGEIDSPWFDNERRIFSEEQGINWIRESWHTAKKNTVITGMQTNTQILQHDWKNRLCISISEQWQLEYLLTHDLDTVNNVWYLGIGFNMGLRREGIGWGNLCDSIRYRSIPRNLSILTKSDCVSVNCEPYSDKLPQLRKFAHPDFSKSDWKKIQHNTYKKTTLEWNHSDLTDFVPVDQ